MLIQASINWSKENRIKNLFLGTMTQFKVFKRSYLKNGVLKIDKIQLPSDLQTI